MISEDADLKESGNPAAVVPSSEPLSSGADHVVCGNQLQVVPLDETIEAIVAAHRERCYWMEQRKRSDLSMGAHVRTMLGWSLALPPEEREAIRQRAADMLVAGERYVKANERLAGRLGRLTSEEANAAIEALPPRPTECAEVIIATIEMRRRVDGLEAQQTKTMEQLARSLPAYEWAQGVRGFGALGLAIIVAEAGDLSKYATKGKLYKRLGLAVIDGVRQGGLPTGAPKDAWIAHGYSPRRRSRIWTIGVAVLMSGNERYRKIYLDRKAYEVAKAEAEGLTVAPAGKIPAKRRHEFRALGHVDARARRYTEKRLLLDLWRAWRRPAKTTNNQSRVGPAEFSDAAE